MKISILFVLSCISLNALGQFSGAKKTVVIYLDSVLIPQNASYDFSDPKNVVDVNVVKSKEDPNSGTIYIKTKNPRDANSYNFLDLKQIERSYTGANKRSTLFMIGGNLIVKDLEDPRIDSSYIRSVQVINSRAITQLKDEVSEFTILNVQVNPKNADLEPKHIATAGIPKLYYAPSEEKKEIKLTLPSQEGKPKEVREFNFLSLKDIEKKYTGSTNQSTLFVLDEELLTTNLSSYQIDSSYLYKVEVLPSNNIEYLKENLPVFSILKISLVTPENTIPKMYIRGSETAMRD